jgi:hypothetical protein
MGASGGIQQEGEQEIRLTERKAFLDRLKPIFRQIERVAVVVK